MSDTASVSALEAEIRSHERVACRIALREREGAGGIRLLDLDHMVLDVLPDQPECDWSVYDYVDRVFINEYKSGEEVASWLSSLAGSAAGRSFGLRAFNSSVVWFRRGSHTQDDFGLWLPHSFFRMSYLHVTANTSKDLEPLVSAQCPSFPSYHSASIACSTTSNTAQAI